jgi:hypothetical protein
MAAKKLKEYDAKMRDVQKVVPVSTKTISRWCKNESDQFPHLIINGRYFFNLGDVNIWIEKHGFGDSQI